MKEISGRWVTIGVIKSHYPAKTDGIVIEPEGQSIGAVLSA